MSVEPHPQRTDKFPGIGSFSRNINAWRKVTSYCSLRNLSVSHVSVSQTNKNKEENVRRDIGGTLMADFL